MGRPFHLWFFGALAILWNLVGAVDYTLTQLRHPAYMAQFTPEQLAYIDAFPTWVVGTWALAAWAGLLGAILLFMGSGLAVIVFAACLAAMLATTVYSLVLADVGMTDIAGPKAVGFAALILVIGAAQWLYARWNRQAGNLR